MFTHINSCATNVGQDLNITGPQVKDNFLTIKWHSRVTLFFYCSNFISPYNLPSANIYKGNLLHNKNLILSQINYTIYVK